MSQSRYQLLSIGEAAKQLDRARWFIYKEMDAKRLAFYLIGKRRMIAQRDLDCYVERSRVRALGEKKTKIPVQEMARV